MSNTTSRASAKQETKRALLQAGLAEISERGLDAPSLDAICARAGFTRGAFYVHFENREDFQVQLMDWVFSTFLDRIVAGDSSDQSIEEVVVRFLEALETGDLPIQQLGGHLPQVLEATQRLVPVRERFRQILQEAIERVAKGALRGQHVGRTRADIDAHALATLLVASALGSMILRDADASIDFASVRENVLTLISSRG